MNLPSVITITTAGIPGLLPAEARNPTVAAYCRAAPVLVPAPAYGTAFIAEKKKTCNSTSTVVKVKGANRRNISLFFSNYNITYHVLIKNAPCVYSIVIPHCPISTDRKRIWLS